jgi:DNA-binding NtrC family response regulator
VRLITATNRDLPAQITAGAFREDLYFRLNVIRLSIPALRDRLEDLPLFVDYFLHTYGQVHKVPKLEVSPEALEALLAYRWPGNVRELKNVVERIVLKTDGPIVRVQDLPAEIMRIAPTSTGGATLDAAQAKAAQAETQAQELAEMMLKHGESFWSAVHPQFMSRDLTRSELRKVIEIGLEHTNGNYRLLVQLFNMPLEDYKRFLSFLRKHDCHLPFQRFRSVPARLRPARESSAVAVAHGS